MMTKLEIEALPHELRHIARVWNGKKVLLLEPHPHSDRVGHVEALTRTHAGWGFEVKFVDGGGAFVFDGNQWRNIK